MTPDTEELIARAKARRDQRDSAREALEEANEACVGAMKDLHESDVSWAEIGRIFGITPQAAMYATGYATRTPKKKPATRKRPAKPKTT